MQLRKRILWALAALCIIGLTAALWVCRAYYDIYFLPNTQFQQSDVVMTFAADTDLPTLLRQLSEGKLVRDTSQFRRYLGASRARTFRVHGRYTLTRGMSTRSMVNLFLSRRQTPVNLVVPSVRTFQELAGRIARQLELDSAELYETLSSPSTPQQYGFTPPTFYAMFVPNTYQVYWTVTPDQLLERLHREYDAFWNGRRMSQAMAANLTPVQVYTLASIVQEEVFHAEELPMVAGVYINRLRIDMPLQACPTAKFAAGDMTITRVLTRHTRIESPYNTYRQPGLPPGPIRIASIQAIDAVLGYQRHDYLFFCARADFSGHHHFSRTALQHAAYAREYQRVLNRRGIR